jgi:hypothetical protein
MDAATRMFVVRRADNCCEYCSIPQSASPFLTFHVEHIIARQHGGSDDATNLALACPDCNRFKGPNISTIDPESGVPVPIFHPRRDTWSEHFEVIGDLVAGLTSIGRATVRLLRMNDDERIEVRVEIREADEP